MSPARTQAQTRGSPAGTRTARRLQAALLAAVVALVQPAAAQTAGGDVLEQRERLPVTVGGHAYALDTLVVRRPGTDKLPIALITHGANPGNPRGATPDWLRGWAHDLAHRGWLAVAVMRRGYGTSDGEVADDAGTCTAPELGRYLDAHADDLEAATQHRATPGRRP